MRHEHFEWESLSIFVRSGVLLRVVFAIIAVVALFVSPRSQGKNVREKLVWEGVDRGPRRWRDKMNFSPGGLTLEILEVFLEAKIGELKHPDFLAIDIDCSLDYA